MPAALFPPVVRRTLLALLCAALALLGGLSGWGGPAAVPVRAATTYTVNSLADDGSAGTLRDAITQVNAGSGGDTITFSVTGTILMTTILPTLEKDVTIQGPGASALAVDGHNGWQVFSVDVGVAATISGLTIQHGNNTGNGGGIYNLGALTVTNSTISDTSASSGGGIYNWGGTLTVTNSTISDTSASTNGGGIFNSSGTVTVTNSTISGTSAAWSGGGIFNSSGTVTVTNSTISGNSATYNGGGIENLGTLTVTNSTISDNSASSGGGGILNFFSGTVTLTNTIVATAPTGGDLAGSFTGTNNLIDDAATAGGFTDGVSGNIVGHPALLGDLGNNGGPTQTISLLPGSPALDAGTASGAPATDQRGVTRPQGSGVDIGAFEARFSLTLSGGNNQSAPVTQPFAQSLTVTFGGDDAPATRSGVAVMFTVTPAANGASATLGTPNPATTDASGQASVTATANGTAGAYSAIAAATGAPSVSFALTNSALTGIAPTYGNPAGGNTVTLTGIGFGTAAATQVLLAGVAIPAGNIQSVTSMQIIYTAPAHAAGPVTVTVVVDGVPIGGSVQYAYGVMQPLPSPKPPGAPDGTPSPLPPRRDSGGSGGSPAPLPGSRSVGALDDAMTAPSGTAGASPNVLPAPRP